MYLISPTVLQKKKLKEMIKKLFPQYQYVKFGPCGIIFLSKSFWHYLLKRKAIHITEMCTVYIPERLEKLDHRIIDDNSSSYRRVYNKYSHIVLDLLHHRANNIIDYLYDEYILVKYGIHKSYYNTYNILPETSYSLSQIFRNTNKRDGVALSPFSSSYIQQTLKRWKEAPYKLNHPILWEKYLNMWFDQEVKQYFRRVYNIRIVIS